MRRRAWGLSGRLIASYILVTLAVVVLVEAVVLGDPGQQARPGLAQTAPDGTLIVPAITGPVPSGQPVTAVVAIAADGTVVASSAPSLYPPGRAAASELPAQAISAIAAG